MATNHELQVRYASLVDKKLRATLVKKPGTFWNTRYQGNPKAGMVKIPVRDAEVAIAAYDHNDGTALTFGATSYLDTRPRPCPTTCWPTVWTARATP